MKRTSGKPSPLGVSVVCDDWTHHAEGAPAAERWRDRVVASGGCALTHRLVPTAQVAS